MPRKSHSPRACRAAPFAAATFLRKIDENEAVRGLQSLKTPPDTENLAFLASKAHIGRAPMVWAVY